MDFKELDPILHSQLRLAVMSLLIGVKEAEFTFLKEKTGATAGNLSVQIQKLKDAGYIEVQKSFVDTGVNRLEKNLYKKALPELSHRVIVRGSNLVVRDSDLIRPMLKYKRRRKPGD